ncbi:MAG: hypothetical protein CMK74_05970 [Pseudomonadales bacterium]|nr:hypothetical protein [Pseudomonadales bacterium]
MKLVNLTPHTLNIHGVDAEGKAFIYNLKPGGDAPRVSFIDKPYMVLDGIAIRTETMSDVEGLPSPIKDVLFVVSQIVAGACLDREDLVYPGPLIRDEDGRPIGCAGLSRKG